MHSFTAIVAASALLTAVSGAPMLSIRGNTCGAAPAGSSTSNQPIEQRTDCQTAAACQTQCEADSSCQSFCFGLIDSTIQCKLYSVPAASIPKQSSTNYVAYDKACSAVPSVVPTASNPTGKKVDSEETEDNNSYGSKTTEQKSTESKKANSQKAAASPKASPKADSSKTNGQKPAESPKAAAASPSPKANGSKTSEQKPAESKKADSSKTTEQKPAESKASTYGSNKQAAQQQQKPKASPSPSPVANTCGSKPSANTSNAPISAPAVSSEDACKTKCKADSSCKSFTCGKVNNAFVCKLYSVAASKVPAPTTTAEKSALKAFDVGCSN